MNRCGLVVVTWATKAEGISLSRPSGTPPGDATSRVNPPISVHGPAAAFCLRQWKYMIRDCHCWYTVACAVRSVWNGRSGPQPASTAIELEAAAPW